MAGETGYKNVGVWNSVTGRLIRKFEGKSPLFSPDGTLIAVMLPDDGGTGVYWTANGLLRTVVRGHTGGIYSVAFSPDSRRIITIGADHEARIWDSGTGTGLAVVELDRIKASNFAAFSSDGTRLAVANLGDQVWVWQAAPYHRSRLPGGNSESWDARYKTWKQMRYQAIAAGKQRRTGWSTPTALAPEGPKR